MLRDKIRRGLATRYLVFEHGRRLPGHDRLKGHIGYGGVIIDGEFVPFEELCAMMETYEGFQFSLTIVDPYISFKGEDGSWTPAKNMGPAINTSDHDDAGDISPDGRYLFFARRKGDEEMDIYWADSNVIRNMRIEK